jgi:hypothetical protein
MPVSFRNIIIIIILLLLVVAVAIGPAHKLNWIIIISTWSNIYYLLYYLLTYREVQKSVFCLVSVLYRAIRQKFVCYLLNFE